MDYSKENLMVLTKDFFGGMTPKSKLLPTEWANEKMVLPDFVSSKGGKYSTRFTPWVEEPQNLLSETQNEFEIIAFKKSVQIAGTTLMINALGYVVDNCPGPIMVVLPSEKLQQDIYKTKIRPMLHDIPDLKNKLIVKRDGSGSTTTTIFFKGGYLKLATCNSDSDLRGLPIKILFLDEVDAYTETVKSTGDPIALAMDRQTTFRYDRKTMICSTPKLKEDSNIELWYNRGDKRVYELPCVHCGEYQDLRFENMTWEGLDEPMMQCVGCDQLFSEYDKNKIMHKARWRATEPNPINPKVASFKINALYSPWVRWKEDVVDKYIAAKEDPYLMQNFVNNVLGEPFEMAEMSVDLDQWLEDETKFCDYSNGIPDDILAITCGIDTQDTCLLAYVVGWDENEKPYFLDHFIFDHIIGSSPEKDAEVLYSLIDLEYTTTTGRKMGLRAAAIDSGGHRTDEVYNFVLHALANTDRNFDIFAIKGLPGMEGNSIYRQINANYARNSDAATEIKCPLHGLYVDRLKWYSYKDLGDGNFVFPKENWVNGGPVRPSFFSEINSEQLATIIKPDNKVKKEWQVKKGHDNHASDGHNYARFCMKACVRNWILLKNIAKAFVSNQQEN